MVALTWSAMTGQTYQAQCNPDLSPGNWRTLGSAVVASGATVTVTDTLATDTQRFYRIVLMR